MHLAKMSVRMMDCLQIFLCQDSLGEVEIHVNQLGVLTTRRTSAIIKQVQEIQMKINVSVIINLISMRAKFLMDQINQKTLVNVIIIILPRMENVSKSVKMDSIKQHIPTVSVQD